MKRMKKNASTSENSAKTSLKKSLAPVKNFVYGVVIGAVLAWSFARDAFWQSFLLFGAEVALGEAGVLFLLGMPLISLIPRIFHLERKNAA